MKSEILKLHWFAIMLFVACCACQATPEIKQFSSQIVISKGGTYTGNWQSTDANVAAVDIQTTEPVTILNSNIRSLGTGIRSFTKNAQINIQNVKIQGLYPTQARATKGTCIDIGLFQSVKIENNELTGCAAGIRLLNFGADINTVGQTASIQFNRFRNMDGRMSDGNGGYLLEHKANGQAIGLNTIRQANVVIAWNEIINLPFQSQAEDVISSYESGGTAQTPIQIHDNYVQGDYAADPAGAIDFSGAGINLGDSPSCDANVGYTDAFNNQVVSFENAGIGVSAGHYQRIWNNRVVSAAHASDGTLLGSSWRTGFGFWNYYNCSNWANNELRDNFYIVASKSLQTQPNYTPSATPTSVFNNIELLNRPPTTADEQAEFAIWLEKLRVNKIVLGVKN